jgi:hypothetical protein
MIRENCQKKTNMFTNAPNANGKAKNIMALL